MSFRDFVGRVKKVPLDKQKGLTVGDFLDRYANVAGCVELDLKNSELSEVFKIFSGNERTRYILVKKGKGIFGIIDRDVFSDRASLKIKYGGYMEEIGP